MACKKSTGLGIAALLASVSLAGGCVVGQSLPTDYEAGPVAVSNGISVSQKVRDERPYIKNGNKPPYFIGLYRGGYGNPFDVTTKDEQPLALLLERDLAKELLALGYEVVAPSEDAKTLDVAIGEWKFDAMINGRFAYELEVRVLGGDGEVLVKSTVKDAQYLKGSIWTGAKGAVEEKMPELYAGAIRKLVRENPSVSAALTSEVQSQ